MDLGVLMGLGAPTGLGAPMGPGLGVPMGLGAPMDAGGLQGRPLDVGVPPLPRGAATCGGSTPAAAAAGPAWETEADEDPRGPRR